MEFIENGLKRNLNQEEYDAVNWFSYYTVGHHSYNETKILKTAEVILDLLNDKTEAKVYSNWIKSVVNGKDYDFHKIQFFCIEVLTK